MHSMLAPTRSLSRPAMRRLIAVSVLAAQVALPRTQASTPLATPPAAAPAPLPAARNAQASAVASNTPTCQAIMRHLSGSLAGTPSTADKPGAVMIDVDKAGVMMACSHSDSIAIPVPGGKPR